MSINSGFEEAEALSKARERAKAIAGELGMPQSCDPLPGESSVAYRARMAHRLTGYTGSFHGQQVSGINDPQLLGAVEDIIYTEAKKYADRRIITPNKLHMVETRDQAGRVISTPSNDSDPRAWMDIFSNGAKYSGRIIDDGKVFR